MDDPTHGGLANRNPYQHRDMVQQTLRKLSILNRIQADQDQESAGLRLRIRSDLLRRIQNIFNGSGSYSGFVKKNKKKI